MTAGTTNRIAVVIPVFNEAGSIEKLLTNIRDKLQSAYRNMDIYVFEDGSSDGTGDALKRLLASGKIPGLNISVTPQRKGYPKAARDAIGSIDASKYSHILFMDGDGQYPMEDVAHLLQLFEGEYSDHDMIVGRRKTRTEPIYRKFLTGGLRMIERVLFRPQIKDITSALRIIRTGTAKNIAARVVHSRYNFWLEFTARMSALDLKVVEVPVGYLDRTEGESRVYSLGKIPKIVWAELTAIFLTWMELNFNKFVKFGIVGSSGALVILSLTWLFTERLHIWYMLSTLIAIEISIIWAFALNTVFTFRHDFADVASAVLALAKYHAVALGGSVINIAVLYVFTEKARVYYLLSEVIAILVAFGFNYLMSTHHVWQNRRK